jgi:protein TorT
MRSIGLVLGAWLLALLSVLPVRAASAERSFCVLVPHFKDEYWLSVGYGLEQAARQRGITLRFFEAGGYHARERQIEQLRFCAASRAEAILLGAVTSDHPTFLATVAEVSQSVPVFGLVNELHAPELVGAIGVDWQDMGESLARFLAERHPQESEPKTAVLISGPAESGWAPPLELGIRTALDNSSLRIVRVFGADTGLRQQLAMVEEALAEVPDMDYLIGSAPAVEAAIGMLASQDRATRPQLVSTYISHTVKRGLLNGQVLAVPFDDPMRQGEMMIDAVEGLVPLNALPSFTGPDILLLTQDNTSADQVQLSPSNYFPTIE